MPRKGPCGSIATSPAADYRPRELLIRLDDDAVTRDGFTPQVLPIFKWLQDAGGRIETLRSASTFATSISTGAIPERPTVPWKVNGKLAVNENEATPAVQHFWARFKDAKWIGVERSHSVAGPAIPYEFTLNLGALIGSRGFFSLFWAGDNNVQWMIDGGGTLAGDLSGINAFDIPAGGPRSLSGTFSATSVLRALVINSPMPGSPDPRSPTGLIVSGTAGRIPEPYSHKDAEVKVEVPVRLTIDPHPLPQQPSIFLGRWQPGAVPVRERQLLSPFHLEIQQELRYLYVYFATVEPDADLIRCLRLVPGVKFAERMPRMRLKLGPDPVSGGEVPFPSASRGMRLMATAASDGPTQITGSSNPGKTIVKFKEPKTPTRNLAILDGPFQLLKDAGNSPTHGTQTYATALDFLNPLDEIEGWVVTEPGEDQMRLLETVANPCNYFTVLRDIRSRNKAGVSTIRVVSLSRGSISWTMMEREQMDEMERADILVVAAAGQHNDGKMVDFPAAFATVLSVGGAEVQNDINGIIQWWHWGAANYTFDVEVLTCLEKKKYAIDVVGPAVNLYVRGTWTVTGTSFATPIVAALCATIRKATTTMKADDVRALVRKTASLANAPTLESGSGMVQWPA